MSDSAFDPTRMKSSTGELRGDDTLYYCNVDYALIEREQIDLEIYSDLSDVTVTIKGQEQTYTYRARDMSSRVKDDRYKSIKYTQGIYQADYEYRKDIYKDNNFQNTDELEIYATYYMKIYNASNNQAQITELVNYYDQGYEKIVGAVYGYNGKTDVMTWNTNSKYKNATEYESCKSAYTNSLAEITIEPWTALDIVIRYKVGKDANRNIILGDKKLATEIYSYSSDEGLIAGSSKPNNVQNQEKDSDIAPILRLELNDKIRKIAGFTWEETINAVVNGIKTGDGLYDAGNESKIDNIEIELVEKVINQDGTKGEYVLAQMNSGKQDLIYADNDGTSKTKQIEIGQGGYEFSKIVPGNYIIRFTYGTNSIDFTYNGQDYKSTVTRGINTANASDAKDNKPRRKEVLEITKTMQNSTAQILADPSSNINEYIKMAAMFADTDELYLAIEHDNTKTDAIDFGLVRRPQTKLQIIKEIQNIKLTNKGIILIDTANGVHEGLMEIPDTTFPDIYRNYMIAMDDEILNGAELILDYKITVKNIGDKDNLANYFEYDTEYGSKEEQDKLFTTSADVVYDYSNSLAFNQRKNPDWEETEDYNILAKDVQAKIESGKYTVLKSEKLSRQLALGESTEVGIQLSRIIGISKNFDGVYLNEVEIVQRSNSGGRRDEEAVPGNYIPGDKTPNERDNWDTDLVITRPTGKARTYYGLIFISAVILGIGVLGIKKFVLDK